MLLGPVSIMIYVNVLILWERPENVSGDDALEEIEE